MSVFQEAFVRLDPDRTAAVLSALNPALGSAPFDPAVSVILARELPFYPGHALCDITDHAATPPRRIFAITGPNAPVLIDWTNAPIYALNAAAPLLLNDSTVADYVRFFFTYVRGRHGRFIVTESADDIAWKEEPPPAARRAVGKLLHPLRIAEKKPDGGYTLKACLMFRDSLFRTDVQVETSGIVEMVNEELAIEDMPVLDDLFGQ
ncbi:MAG: hypothetical protein H6862_01795 [Rhodospirillales bacterium]|nr:hypothetical protein [Rhodospirillales bacterium]